MNVEQAFIKTNNVTQLIECIKSRIVSAPDEFGTQPDVGLPNSYDSILAVEQKREIAISEEKNGWVSILESKEVNDYKMLLEISLVLDTELIAIVVSNVTASCGFVEMKNGKVIESYFSEDEEDFEGFIFSKLMKKGIDTPVCMFREVASKKIPGWQVISKAPQQVQK